MHTFVRRISILNLMNMQTTNLSSLLPPRATVNQSGILWFDLSSGHLLGFDKCKYMRIATEKGDPSGSVLYLIPSKSLIPKSTFRIGKNGLYYYVNLKRFFKSLNLCFERKIISYNILNIWYDGRRIWMLRKNT